MRDLVVALFIGLAPSTVWSQARLADQPDAPTQSVAERAEFYQSIARETSTAKLERLAREILAASSTTAQLQHVGFIIDRYYELDRLGAVGFAREVEFAGGPSLAPALYQQLSRDDTNAALAALSQIDDASEAVAAASAILRGLGSDERAFSLVAASLHGAALERFQNDAIVQIATRSPELALQKALSLPNNETRGSITSFVIGEWARTAPRDAIAAVERIQDPALQSMLRGVVLREWDDFDSLIAYVETLDANARSAALESGALMRLVQVDARRVASYVAALPPSEQRHSLMYQVGSSFALQDAGAALEWARSLETPDPTLLGAIVAQAAQKDPVHAFGLAETLDEPARSQAFFAVATAPVIDQRQFSTLANRVLRLPESQTRTSLLMTLTGSAANRPDNLEPTLEWMIAAGAAVPPEAFQQVGFSYARANPAAAAALIDRIPRNARSEWVVAVTSAYGAIDVQSATAYLERFRGDPAFDRAAIVLSQQLAVTDPPAAARLLSSVKSRGLNGIGPEIGIARQWAQRDPAAAAAWALDLPFTTRQIAISMITDTWAQQDPAGVRDWALRQPAGEKRDVALTAAVRARGAAAPDSALLNAFSDENARQAAMMATIIATAQSDVPAARRLIDSYITAPRLRTQATEVLANFERGFAPLPSGFGASLPPIPGVPSSIIGVGTSRGVMTGYGQPVTVIGPNGQPMVITSPVPPGAAPSPSQSQTELLFRSRETAP